MLFTGILSGVRTKFLLTIPLSTFNFFCLLIVKTCEEKLFLMKTKMRSIELFNRNLPVSSVKINK